MNKNFPDNPQIQVLKSGKTGLFTNYIYKAIPLAFDESMSYYETLCGLLNYLKNVVIPTVNNNADAAAELQTLYEQLRSYVEDYFTNLDVQEEINNKLDAMVEDGTLPEIVASYLNSKAIFGFDSVASMKESTNLINGSYAETLGYYSKNDGGSALYKIRNITNEDTVDEMFIIALSNPNLIAELIINDILNIKQIGGYGNNTNDDTSLFQYALNNSTKILIPDGDYKITDTLNVNDNTYIKLSNNAKIHISTNNDVFNIGNFVEIEGGIFIQDNKNLTGYIINHKSISYGCLIHNIMFNGNPVSDSVKSGGFLKFDYNQNGQYAQFNNYENINVNFVEKAIYSVNDGTNNWVTACHFTNWRIWHCSKIVDGKTDGCLYDGLTIQCNPTDTLLFDITGKWNNFRNLIYFDLPSNCKIIDFKSSSAFNIFELWYTGQNYPYTNRYTDNGNRNSIKIFGDTIYPTENIELNDTYCEGTLNYIENGYYSGVLKGHIKCLNLTGQGYFELGTLPTYTGATNFFGFDATTGDVIRINVLENKTMIVYNAEINHEYDIYQYVMTLH